MSNQTTQDEHEQTRHASVSPWYLLLLAPFVATLWVPFYNSVEPTFLGFPFFYAYQLVWVLIGAALTAVVYVMTAQR